MLFSVFELLKEFLSTDKTNQPFRRCLRSGTKITLIANSQKIRPTFIDVIEECLA